MRLFVISLGFLYFSKKAHYQFISDLAAGSLILMEDLNFIKVNVDQTSIQMVEHVQYFRLLTIIFHSEVAMRHFTIVMELN
jgi:hypothetical protein